MQFRPVRILRATHAVNGVNKLQISSSRDRRSVDRRSRRNYLKFQSNRKQRPADDDASATSGNEGGEERAVTRGRRGWEGGRGIIPVLARRNIAVDPFA